MTTLHSIYKMGNTLKKLLHNLSNILVFFFFFFVILKEETNLQLPTMFHIYRNLKYN